MQDAFVSESGTTYGSWKYIGYEMKSNTVFTYKEGGTSGSEGGTGSATTTALATSAAQVWTAQPKAALNDCKTPSTDGWQLSIKTANSGNGAAYQAGVSTADCNVLAPSYGKLDESGAATIAALK